MDWKSQLKEDMQRITVLKQKYGLRTPLYADRITSSSGFTTLDDIEEQFARCHKDGWRITRIEHLIYGVYRISAICIACEPDVNGYPRFEGYKNYEILRGYSEEEHHGYDELRTGYFASWEADLTVRHREDSDGNIELCALCDAFLEKSTICNGYTTHVTIGLCPRCEDTCPLCETAEWDYQLRLKRELRSESTIVMSRPCLALLRASYNALAVIDSISSEHILQLKDTETNDLGRRLVNARLNTDVLQMGNLSAQEAQEFARKSKLTEDRVVGYYILESLFTVAVLRWAEAWKLGSWDKERKLLSYWTIVPGGKEPLRRKVNKYYRLFDREELSDDMKRLCDHFLQVRNVMLAHYDVMKPEYLYMQDLVPMPYDGVRSYKDIPLGATGMALRGLDKNEWHDFCRLVEFSIGRINRLKEENPVGFRLELLREYCLAPLCGEKKDWKQERLLSERMEMPGTTRKGE